MISGRLSANVKQQIGRQTLTENYNTILDFEQAIFQYFCKLGVTLKMNF